jgi:hypothetical protein
MTNPVSASSASSASSAFVATHHQPSELDKIICGAPPSAPTSPQSGAVASAATPGLDQYQSALNDFGRMVGEAQQGKHFNDADMGRLDKLLKAYGERTDVTPEQKAAMREIAAKFKASGGGPNGLVDSNGWADFMTGVGGLLMKVPGAERFGQALQDFAEEFRTAYNPKDGIFGKDDMEALLRKGGASDRPRATADANKPGSEVDKLRDLAKDSHQGPQFGAADFGRFLTGVKIPGETSPAPLAPSAPAASAAALATGPAASVSSASAVATGAGAKALNLINHGTINLDLESLGNPGRLQIPHAFSDEMASLKT